MVTEDRSFVVDGTILRSTIVYADSGAQPYIVALHGTGSVATRARIRYILDYLATNGMSSVTFDFSGHGDSGGMLTQCTLNIRVREAEAAAMLLDKNRSPVLIGTSMGAYLAALLTPTLKPQGLILFCPAAYPSEAMGLKFDEGFKAFCRRPDVYVGSPAFQSLEGFKGNLLIVAAEQDAVIPAEVVNCYAESAPVARSIKVIWVKGSDHRIHSWLGEREEQRAVIQRAVLAAVTESNSLAPIGTTPHGGLCAPLALGTMRV